MRALLLSLCFFFTTVLAFGQVLVWEKTLSFPFNQQIRAVQVHSSSIYMAGSMMKFINGIQEEYLSLIKTNNNGDTLINRDYQFPGLSVYFPHEVYITANRDIVVIGGAISTTPGITNSFYARFDSLGNIMSFNVYNLTTVGRSEASIALPDGGYLITGARNVFSGGNIDIYFTRIDSLGQIVKDTSYSKTFTQQAFSIEPLYDGSYLIGGVTGTAQGPAAYALQVDLWGRVIRDTVIQTPISPFNNQNVRFRQLADDNWSITGSVGTSTPFVYRVGPQFQPQSATYSTNAVSNNRYVSYPTIDSGFLYVGSGGTNNVYLRKFGKTNNVQWTYSFFTSPARIRLFNDLMIGSNGEILGGGAIRDTIGAATDYYWAKLSSSEQPFLKNLCRSAPVASFSVQDSGGVFVLRNTSTTGLQYNPTQTWEWYNPNTLQTGSDSVLILPGNLPPGYPMVLRMRNYYGCTDTLQADVLQVLGGGLAAAEEAYRPTALYPIPARGVVYVEPGSRHTGSLHAEVLSPDGRLLGRHPLTAQGPTAVQVQGMAAGVYLLRVQSSAHSEVLRWVKE